MFADTIRDLPLDRINVCISKNKPPSRNVVPSARSRFAAAREWGIGVYHAKISGHRLGSENRSVWSAQNYERGITSAASVGNVRFPPMD